jgi:hypothetical protein
VLTSRGRKTILFFLISLQLLSAGTLRWHVTTATLKTEYDYLLGFAVIAGDNWHREGAVARHFVPSRSVDQNLPEWMYRDDYWRDYLSQPPLSFMLHYAAMRIFDAADPVVVGKVVAQVQIAAGVVAAAAILFEVFGFAATLAGLSFLIWGRPFLLWFIDGYYSTTTAMVCQFLLVAWCLALFKRAAASVSSAAIRSTDYLVVGLLAYAGTFSEWVALFGNVVAALAFLACAIAFRITRSARATSAFAIAVTIAAASAAAVLSMALLYGTKVGFAFFVRQFLSRVDERTGAGGFWEYTGILIKQMETSWPAGMLVLLSLMTLFVVAYAIAGFARSRRSQIAGESGLLLLTIVLGFGAAVSYCYRLKDLVTIHWWFSGTWVVGWTMTVCAFVYVARDIINRGSNRTTARLCDVAFTSVVLVGAVGWNLAFANLLTAQAGAVAEGTVLTPAVRVSHELYRAIGRALPRDYAPLIVPDMPDLFNDYPFGTAYVRRPVVRYDASGALLKLGTTEDARPALVERGGFAYLAYDRSLRACPFFDATPDAWRRSTPLGFCIVPASSLSAPSASLFRDPSGGSNALLVQWVRNILSDETCCPDERGLLGVTRLLQSRLRLRSGEAIDRVRRENGEALRALVGRWQQRLGGTVHVVDPRFSSLAMMGVLGDAQRWYLLVANPEGTAVPDFHSGVDVLVNGAKVAVMTPYQIKTNDGKAILPLSLIEIRSGNDLAQRNVTVEIVEAGAPLMRTTNVTIVRLRPDGATRDVEADALLSVSTGCSGPPGPPFDLRIVANAGGRLVLSWTGTYGGPVSYVLQAGAVPGGTNVTDSDLGDTSTTFTATGVPRGAYYLRIRGKNSCGVGVASNEAVAVVR